MTDDLVSRLRYQQEWGSIAAGEAANRIEALEAALREIANAVGDPSAYWIACVALGKTNEK